MGKEWKKRHRYFRQWAKSERKDIDTSDNGQRVKEKTWILQIMGKEWKKRHRYFRQWAKSERKDIDSSDNGQRVKEKT